MSINVKEFIPSAFISLKRYIAFLSKSDKKYLSNKFKGKFGRPIDFQNPGTLNEKIITRKLFRNPGNAMDYVNKISVKDFIKKRSNINIIPTLKTLSINDINYNSLSNLIDSQKNGIYIKTNHDSGSVFYVDKTNLTKTYVKHIKQALKISLKCNYYWYSREWVYSGITPTIFVEPNITKKNETIIDYKFFVFNEQVKFALIINKGTRRFFDINGALLPFDWDLNPHYKNGQEFINDVPENYQEMIRTAESLSAGFQFVRVDLYSIDHKIYFGEYTFFPNDGLHKFDPPEWDAYYGEALDISSPTL